MVLKNNKTSGTIELMQKNITTPKTAVKATSLVQDKVNATKPTPVAKPAPVLKSANSTKVANVQNAN